MTPAGQYRQLLTFQHITGNNQSDTGQVSSTWGTLLQVHGSLTPVSGREMEYAKSFAATVSHQSKCRYFPGLKPSMRIVVNGRTFAINAVLNVEERNREYLIFCTENADGVLP